jgi:hypothetical protein
MENQINEVDIPLQKTIDKCPKCGEPAMTKKDSQYCKNNDCPLKIMIEH